MARRGADPARSSGGAAATIVPFREFPEDGRAHRFPIEAAVLQQTQGGRSLIADQAEDDVLSSDV